MANDSMNFGVDLLPVTTNTYNLGSSSKKWIINGVSDPKLTDTTYSSLSEANGGTAVSLVTTGEKYTWNRKLSLSGGTMTGALTLAAAPTANMHAATKQYVDAAVAGSGSSYVLKAGDTMTGALKAKGLRTYVSDTNGNASLNFGETADSTRLGRITMNTTTNIMEFDEGNERYLLPAPTAESVTSYDIVTTNGSYTLGGQLNIPGINSYAATWPGYGFALNTAPTTALASLNYDNSNKCFTFVSPSNDGTDTTEAFSLPQETLTDGNWHSYAILTSKTAVTIAQGGTNATTAAGALTNLGAVAKTGDTMTGNLIISNGSNYKGLILKGDSSSPTISFYNTGSRLTIDQYANGSTGGERYLLPTPNSLSADVWYNIITNKNITQTLPGQLILSKTTDISASASSESALVIGTKTGYHLAFDIDEIMAKSNATTVGDLHFNYDGGNIIMGVNNSSYYVQVRSTAAATSATTGALRVGGGIGVSSGIYSGGDITIQGPTYPAFSLKKANGTALGSFYASANSGRVNIRTWNTAGTYYVDYGLPDDSDNDASRARYFLTTKDFDFVNYSGTSGTMAGLVKSGNGIWLVSVYDNSDASKYWVGIVVKKTSANPIVQLLKNASITCSGGNTIGTMVFSGGSNYVAKALKIA